MRVWQAALLIGLAVFAAPLATVEQPPAQGASHRFPRGGASPAGYAHLVKAFRQGLRDLGYRGGRNLAIGLTIPPLVLARATEIIR